MKILVKMILLVLVFEVQARPRYLTLDYPVTNRWGATVVSTPTELLHQKEDMDFPILNLKSLKPVRKKHRFFYFDKGFKYTALLQEGEAPLLFCIAGTGATYRSSNVEKILEAFYQAGYHVVGLSSPTTMNFMLNASTRGIPGLLAEDAKDLKRVMEEVVKNLNNQAVKISDYYLTGYSLGATHAAYVAELDSREPTFNFKRVVLLNPTVNLINSVSILDELVPAKHQTSEFLIYFLDKVVDHFGMVYRREDTLDFTDDLLFYEYDDRKPNEETLKQFIWMSFRLSAINMVFTADLNLGRQVIFDEPEKISAFQRLEEYTLKCLGISYLEAFETFLIEPAVKEGANREEFLQQFTLNAIEPFLKTSENIQVMTSNNEIILKPEDFDFLKETFGSRLLIYDRGGHCGILKHYQFVEDLIELMEGEHE